MFSVNGQIKGSVSQAVLRRGKLSVDEELIPQCLFPRHRLPLRLRCVNADAAEHGKREKQADCFTRDFCNLHVLYTPFFFVFRDYKCSRTTYCFA